MNNKDESKQINKQKRNKGNGRNKRLKMNYDVIKERSRCRLGTRITNY